MTLETFIPSAEDMHVAADTDSRAKALRQWMGDSCSYHPSELPDHIRPPTNELLSHAERVQFVTKPLKAGEKYTAYLSSDRKRITTWTGETLGQVTSITRRRVRNSPMTDECGTFTAVAIDGRQYKGRHNGTGMYCTLQLADVSHH
jgi:hypothetical protein